MKVTDFTIRTPNNDCKGCYFDNLCNETLPLLGTVNKPIVNALDQKYGICACSHIYVEKKENQPVYESVSEASSIMPQVTQFIKDICKMQSIPYESLNTKSNKRKYVYPRQLVSYFLKKRTTLSLSVIGNLIEKDHATVIHGRKAIERLLTCDKPVQNDVEYIKSEILPKYDLL